MLFVVCSIYIDSNICASYTESDETAMTLTETAYYTRKIIKYSIFFVLFAIIARFSWEIGFTVYRKFYPEPPPPPTVTFGKLPKLPFGDKKDTSGFTFNLQTPTGEFPKFPASVNVYFVPQKVVAFLDLEEATKLTRSLGFSGDITNISETIYRFEASNEPASIDIDIVNRTFSLNYNLAKAPELLGFRPKSTEDAAAAASSFLSRGNLLSDDLAREEKNFEFIKATPTFPSVSSLSEANFIRVNLHRAGYDEMPVLGPDKKRANVWFLVAGDKYGTAKIIAGEYHYFPVDTNQSSTYPVKTGEAAWEDLKNGRGVVISQPENIKDITVRRIYLAYYDPGEPHGFLQPIIVFEGDGDFTAYLPAVTDEFYGGD